MYDKWDDFDIVNFPFLDVENRMMFIYEGDPRSNANPSVISSTFSIPKNGIHVYYHILSIL